jgi:hypothetical protein
MAFEKQWKGIQDAYPGKQEWNRLVTAATETRDALGAEHEDDERAFSPLGSHDVVEIPIGTARVAVTERLWMSSVRVTVQSRVGAIRSIERVLPGRYLVQCGNLRASAWLDISVETNTSCRQGYSQRVENLEEDAQSSFEVLILEYDPATGLPTAVDSNFTLTLVDPL